MTYTIETGYPNIVCLDIDASENLVAAQLTRLDASEVPVCCGNLDICESCCHRVHIGRLKKLEFDVSEDRLHPQLQ